MSPADAVAGVREARLPSSSVDRPPGADLNEQVYINSIIAMRKFKHIKAGYQYLYAALPLFVLLVGAHGLGL